MGSRKYIYVYKSFGLPATLGERLQVGYSLA